MKEARHNRPHIVWFHLYAVVRVGKSIEKERRLVVARCMVRPFKMAVVLFPVHPLLDQCLLHSHDYPIPLIIGLNQ